MTATITVLPPEVHPQTADNLDALFGMDLWWKYNPTHPFRRMSGSVACPAKGGCSEPICEMYAHQSAAQTAFSRL